jgi:hypothetical protein
VKGNKRICEPRLYTSEAEGGIRLHSCRHIPFSRPLKERLGKRIHLRTGPEVKGEQDTSVDRNLVKNALLHRDFTLFRGR